jgi:hypothetical protein
LSILSSLPTNPKFTAKCQPILSSLLHCLSSLPSANHQIVLEILINTLFRDAIRTNLHPILYKSNRFLVIETSFEDNPNNVCAKWNMLPNIANFTTSISFSSNQHQKERGNHTMLFQNLNCKYGNQKNPIAILMLWRDIWWEINKQSGNSNKRKTSCNSQILIHPNFEEKKLNTHKTE